MNFWPFLFPRQYATIFFFPRVKKLLRYPPRKGLVGSKPYLTLLSIDEHNLYYEGRDRVSLPEGSRRGILLYSLK